jgi:nitrogen PTS system EIIA component
MRIAECLSRRAVVPDLKAATKDEVLRELAGALALDHPEIDGEDLFDALAERERLGSTGLKDGVAIPHAKAKGARRIAMAVGRSQTGIDFDSVDRKPATLFFLLVAPENAPGSHLKALARIVEAGQDESFRRAMARAKGDREIREILRREDERAKSG